MDSISQHSLHDELLDRLRTMIIGGQFSPGDKIPERQLCEQFGVSRTPLREALKVLAAEGLVQLAPNHGAVVVSLSLAEIEECVPISAAIEGLSGELACQQITDAEIEEIKALHTKMIAGHQSGNMSDCLQANRLLHERIVAAARNPFLASIYDTLFFRIGWPRLISQLPKEEMTKAIADHSDIMQALEDRKGQRLSELLRAHWECLFDAYRNARPPAGRTAS
jgi:DNA-binding GntR family transcriptional regulator